MISTTVAGCWRRGNGWGGVLDWWGGDGPNLSLGLGSAAGIADIGYEPTDGETEKGTLNTHLNSEIVGWLREFVITEG